MTKTILNFAKSLDKSINLIGQLMKTGNNFDHSVISEEAFKLINNPEDKKKLDEAVDYLQKHTYEKFREVELSDKNTIIISLG